MSFRPRYTGLIERYRDRLPVNDDTRLISLGEGNTPLIKLNHIAKELGKDVDIYVKYEGLNPTGSFKDRGMTMAATVIQIKGNFDEGMRLVKEVANHAPVTIVNSINPYRLQGQKTAAFEIVEELGRAPDYHCLPVGNAGNITAHWIGYCEYSCDSGDHVTDACAYCGGKCKYAGGAIVGNRPKMVGYQASGSAPFMRGHMVDDPETVATAIRIGHPQSWDKAWQVKEESGGWFDECSDEEILAAQKLLAEKEGVFCEPASATSLAGALRDVKNGKIPEGSTIVCTLTGHGLKDPDTAIKQSSSAVVTVDANLESVRDAIIQNMAQ